MLIDAVGSEGLGVAWSANRILRAYTQEDIDLASDATAATRHAPPDAWGRWWRENSGRFVVNVGAARVDEACCQI